MSRPGGAAGRALLDPEQGLILGWAAPRGGRPARLSLRLDGREALAAVAARRPSCLGAAAARLGAPAEPCAFALRLPERARGRRLDLTAGGEAILSAEFEDDRALARYREGGEMADAMRLERPRLLAGRLRGLLVAEGPAPALSLRLRGETLGPVALAPAGTGRWEVEAALPPERLSEGVQVFEIAAADGSTLARLPVAAGAALAGDLVAEVAALRAELDLLKGAVREALAGGAIRRDERPMIVAEALSEMEALLEWRDRAERDAAPSAAWEEEEPDPLWDVRE